MRYVLAKGPVAFIEDLADWLDSGSHSGGHSRTWSNNTHSGRRGRRDVLNYVGRRSHFMVTLSAQPLITHVAPIDPIFLKGDKIQPGHPLFGLIWINPERVSG